VAVGVVVPGATGVVSNTQGVTFVTIDGVVTNGGGVVTVQ